MKKLFTLALAMLASVGLWAGETVIFGPFTLTSDNNVKDQVNAVTGGTAVVTTAFATGGTNEITVDALTYYKFNSSSAIECTLANAATFQIGDSIEVLVASNTSKKTTGVKLNNSINVFGDIPGNTAVKFAYVVKADDGIAGQNKFTINRYSSDSKFGTVKVFRADAAPATEPVTEVTIAGPTTAYIGYKVTLTASADVAADTIWWTDQYGQKQDSKDGVFSFTPDAAGEYTYTAWAENQFNDNPVTKAHTVTVTKLCGELIKVTQTGQSSATVTGTLTGTADVKLSSGTSTYDEQTGRKIGSDNYWLGVKDLSYTLRAGDVVTVFCTTVSANLILYSDKGSTKVGEMIGGVQQGENNIVLNANATGKNALYLYRVPATTDEKAGGNMNPYVAYISVTRACEESDNNNAAVTINGEAAEKSGTVFNYTLSASYAEPTVAVEITLEHPLATLMEDHAASFTMATPEAGQKSVETFKVKAENGEQAWYSIFVEKAASLNNDATLKALSVAGLTLDPAFDAETTDYTVTKAYEAAMPAVDDVTATATDANAKSVNVVLAGNVFTITVTAEDNTTTKEYTITVNSAPAIKSLSRVLFSNGFDAFIDNTNRTVKAFYLNGTEAPTATTITAGANCTAGEIADGKIVVTGADESLAEYAVTLEAVAANTNVVEESAEAGTFDGTEAWVKAGLYLGNAAGFDGGKYVLRRQLKSGDAADDQRVIAGWVRAYFFVGNASKLELTQTSNKGVKYAIDGGEAVEASGDVISIALEEGNHMIEIVTNQQKGNCELSAPKLVKRPETPTALDNADAAVKAVKRIENGQLFIEKNGVIYNAQGARLQ